MRAFQTGLLVAVCCVIAAGCQTTLRPTTDFDPSVDFSQYSTFSWIDANPLMRISGQRPPNPLVQQRLMTTARQAFTARGLRYAENPADADLVLAFTVGSREGIQVTSYPASWQRAPMGRRSSSAHWGGYWNTSTVRTRQYTEGQLAIDILDVAEQRPVWHGTVSRRITQRDLGDPGPALEEAVQAIAAKFPPGS